MIQVEVNDEKIEAGVIALAEELNLSKDAVIHRALEQMLEDRADYVAGMHVLQTMKYTISADEMEKRSELAD